MLYTDCLRLESNFLASTRPLTAKLHWCPFSSVHMFPNTWSCTTTIGLPEFYIRVCLKVMYVWRKIQEAQSNDLLRTCTACLSMRLDTPLLGNNARGIKYAVYYTSNVTHIVFENIKWLHSRCVRIKKVQSLPLFVYSLLQRAGLLPCVCMFAALYACAIA